MNAFVVAAAAMLIIHLAAIWRRPRIALFVSAILWLLYAIWERLIATGVACDPGCNIRVDLVLIFPILLIATIYAHSAYRRPKGQRTIVGMILGAAGLGLLALLVWAFGYAVPAILVGVAALMLAAYAIKSRRDDRREPS